MTVSCEEREREKRGDWYRKKRLTGLSLTHFFLTYFDLKRTKRRPNIVKKLCGILHVTSCGSITNCPFYIGKMTVRQILTI